MFDGHYSDWQLFGMFLLVGEPAHPRTAVIENSATRAAPIPTIAARHHNSHGMLVGKELAGLLPELQPLDELLKKIFTLCNMHRIFRDFFQVSIVIPLEQRLV